MNAEQYVDERLEDQICFYDRRSKQNQVWFRSLRVIEIVAAALIPLLAGFKWDGGIVVQITVGILGCLVAIAAGVSAVYKFQENWIDYRSTAEALKHEKYAYLTSSAPYDVEDKGHMLVERVESLVSTEHTHWHQRMSTDAGGGRTGRQRAPQ